MQADAFNQIFDHQVKMCTEVLVTKSNEYATADRLHNFKVAATLGDVSVRQALAGMLAKHTVSLYDMCGSDAVFPMAVWDEKITDHINYLFILKAIVHEEAMGKDQDTNDLIYRHRKDTDA